MFFYQLVPLITPVLIPPQLSKYKCVLLIEREIKDDLRHEISSLLVASGCLYMMAWGDNCSAWDDSVDYANMEQFDYGNIPDDKLVMTTWHDRDSLEDVLRFAKIDAYSSFSGEPLTDILVLDFARQDRAAMIEDIYNRAK